MKNRDRKFRTLFNHYEAYEESWGDFTYLDVKAIPIGLFGNVLIRILEQYKDDRLYFRDSIKLSESDGNFRMMLIFEERK